MSNKSENHTSDEDAKLNQLIRESEKDERDTSVRPSADSIAAYLMGRATEEQAREVKRAILHSKAFARELLAMTEDLDALAEVQTSMTEREMQQIAVPERRRFLKGDERGVSERHVPPDARPESFIRKLYHTLWPKAPLPLRPALLYILLLLLVIPAYRGMVMLAKKEPVKTMNIHLDERRSTKAEAKTVEIEPQTEYLLHVPLEKQILGDSLHLTIELVDGETIWEQDVFVSPGLERRVSFKLPESKLRSRTYRLIIDGPRTGEDQERYLKIVKR